MKEGTEAGGNGGGSRLGKISPLHFLPSFPFQQCDMVVQAGFELIALTPPPSTRIANTAIPRWLVFPII